MGNGKMYKKTTRYKKSYLDLHCNSHAFITVAWLHLPWS